MYAKLVYSAGYSSSTAKSAGNMIRDIVRLCTSSSPNVTNLIAFSNTSSVVVNTTSAGWSLLYSNGDGETLPNANTDANAANTLMQFYWTMTAPCLGPSANTIKYAKLTTTQAGNVNFVGTSNVGFSLTSASSISNTGTVTGEGFRIFLTGTNSTYASYAKDFDLSGNGTYHVIATERQLTIIKEGFGFHSVWEHTVSDYHTFYNVTPVIVHNYRGRTHNYLSANVGSTTPAGPDLTSGTRTLGIDNAKCLHNITDVNSGTNYSILHLGRTQSQPYMSTNTDFTNMKTVAANGVARNLVVPIMYQLVQYGIPTCFVTDICDMYWTGGGIGTTGDTIVVNGVTYTYFDCGTMGLAINVGTT